MKIAEKSSEFLIAREGAAYPPHHVGDHLEEAFLKFWDANGVGDRKLIPVHWTAVYNHRSREGLGIGTPNGTLRNELKKYLNSLDRKQKYFVVCTHDDAPTEDLPPDTVVFGAGGNSNKIDVAIPLTCSRHENPSDRIRTIPISFIGAVTHKVRFDLLHSMHQRPGVVISADHWTPEIATEKIDLFRNIAEQSIFSLCPRGYGATSYRLYESIQLGSIPVYVSDRHLLPWSDEIDWSDFCVVRSEKEIPVIYEELMNFTGTKVSQMQAMLQKVWNEYFSIEGTCNQIFKRVR
jgi:hypothetical protein